MSINSKEFLESKWQQYWEYSYQPIYVDFIKQYEINETYFVTNIRYKNDEIVLILMKKEELINRINESNYFPSIINVNNLISLCEYFNLRNNIMKINYSFDLNLKNTYEIDNQETKNPNSNIAELHFLIFNKQ